LSLKKIELDLELYAMITCAEDLYQLPHRSLVAIARIESAFKVDARNPHSSAKGLFQFIDSTARMYGIDPMDPAQAAGAAALMAHQNTIYWGKHIHRPLEPCDLYLMHQQGPAGASKIVQAAAGQRQLDGHQIKVMSLNLPRYARMRFNGMRESAAKAKYFMSIWAGKFSDAQGAYVVGEG
jgi:hypothetical protein